MDKKRTMKRYPIGKPARLKNTIENLIDDVFLKDISGNGAKIETKKFMVSDDQVTLIFQQENQVDSMALDGTIVWKKHKSSNLWDVGIQFNEVPANKVEDMIKHLHAP